MKSLVWLLSAAVVSLTVSFEVMAADAGIYRCEVEAGVVIYQSSAAGKNCRLLDLAPLVVIPAAKSAKPVGSAPGSAGVTMGGGRPAVPTDTGPQNFPRVDSATQRFRDSDRVQILEEELQKEVARLVDLKEEYKDGQPDRIGGESNYQKYLDRKKRLEEEIGRTDANVASLRRELEAATASNKAEK